MTDARKPQAQPPDAFTGLHLGEPKHVAGGLPAIEATFGHILREMGPVRGMRILRRINQHGGVDCPSCAWPEPDHKRPAIEFCENGAKAIAEEATTKTIGAEFFRDWSLTRLAEQPDYWLSQQGRLTQPMWRPAGKDHYEPISWDAAFRLIAGELNALGSPDEAIFYTSGRTSNEAAFLYQLFVRAFGTNNLPDCGNMCHESSGEALMETLGVGVGTVTLEDFAQADAIFIIGQNPGTNHPRMLTTLQEAARRGCKIVGINPLPEPALQRFKHPQEVLGMLGRGQPISCLFMQVRINGDTALMKAIMKTMWEAEKRAPGTVFDQNFIRDYTHGYEALVADLEAADWDTLIAQSGVPRAQIEEAAAIAMGAKRIICCWAMGLTQHKEAVATIREVTNFLLLGGHVGKPGAGACPVRGHSNVQGDRTMGIYEKPSEAFLNALQAEFGFDPPRRHGHGTVDAIKAMHAGKASVFFGLGGNFLSATPDTEFTAEALRRCRLTVQVSLKLNRSHLITGAQALILPCLGRTERDVQASGEQFVTTENSMGIVQSSRGTLDPIAPDLLSETAIVARLATATLGDRMGIPWLELAGDYDRIRDHIARVVPGMGDYNRQVRTEGGFYRPNGPRDRREFKTATGKANFTVNALPEMALEPDQLVLMTIRSHDQFNTTIYGLDDRYRGVYHERRVVFMNPDDMRDRNLRERQVVDLTSHFRGETRSAKRFMVVPFDIPRRCAAAYFPETNVLVPVDSFAERSLTPTSKSIVITVAPSTETP